MNKTIDIELEWIEFAMRSLPEEALKAGLQSVQYRMMRRAFYAGAGQITLNLREKLGRPEVSEEEAVAAFQGVIDQVNAMLIEEVHSFNRGDYASLR